MLWGPGVFSRVCRGFGDKDSFRLPFSPSACSLYRPLLSVSRTASLFSSLQPKLPACSTSSPFWSMDTAVGKQLRVQPDNDACCGRPLANKCAARLRLGIWLAQGARRMKFESASWGEERLPFRSSGPTSIRTIEGAPSGVRARGTLLVPIPPANAAVWESPVFSLAKRSDS